MPKPTFHSFFRQLSTDLLQRRLADLEREVTEAKPGVDVRAPEKIAVIRAILAQRGTPHG